MSSPAAPPPPPDPAQTAAAQAKSNKETAVAQYGLNATNQVTPEGTLSYKQIGTWADGTPRFESTQALSPAEQGIYDIGTETRRNVGTIGRDQSARIGELLGKPVQMGNEATEARLMELGSKRLDPMFARNRAALENKLANQGVTMGSEAWRTATGQFGEQENDAYNQLLLAGRGQANQELLTERNQPINEITALLSGSQVSQPNWVGTPQTSVAPTDVAGISANYQNILNDQYKTKAAQQNAMMGGLFGLGGTATKAAMPFLLG